MNNMGEPMNDAWDSRKHEATPVPLKVNTAVNTAINKEAVVTSTPLSPTNFRRLTSTSNARQSWVFCKQRPIPETESVVEPTPIIHPRGFSASSRLSILIQGSPGRHMHNPSSPTTFRSSERDRMTETVETAATALTTTTVTINEAPDLEKEVEEVVQTIVEEKAALVSPPLGDSSRYLTNAFDTENDYDGVPYASPSFSSVASSSQSNYTAHRDSISDTSVLSSSPAASEQQPIIARTAQHNGLNLRSLSYSSSFSVQKNRHSMPTAPNIGGQPPPGVGPRRASMPVLSAKESTAGATESLPVTVSPTSIEVSSIQLTPTTFSNEDQEENDELTQLEARQRHSFSSSDLIASPTLGNRPQSTISTVSTATFSSMSTTSSMSTAITNITSSNTTDGTEKGVANRSDGPGVNTLRRSGILDTSHARLSSAALYNGRLSVRLSRFSAPTPMQMRQSIALEILTTERHYVECLTLLQRLFLRPLLDSLSTPYPILSKKSITNIFANFLDIVSLNTELLKRLEERIASEIYPWNPEDGCVGDIFLDMGPFFKMYSLYVNNFESALTAIEVQLRERPAFSAFLRDVIKTGQCKGLTFQAYLIMPVQRIPRYKMLVDDLLKKTPESHPDYLNLKKASHVIDHVATFVNETIRQHEMFLKMLDIQRSLSGFDEVLLVPGRKLIKRGTVSKICRKNHQEREFFLFTDILIYASPGLLDDMYNFHRKFDLEDLIVLPLDESAGRNTGFQLLSPQKSFTVYAESTHEKQLWIDAIRETKEEYLSAKRTLKISDNLPEKRATLRKRVVENYYAPFWVPDEKAERCMNCNDEFTMFRRKHHCRACGKVVCHACSTRNFVISGKTRDRDQIVRACDPCFFTMFPDALEDEDLAPGVQVWDSVGYGGSSNASTSPSHVRKASTGTARSDVSTIPSEGGSLGARLNPFKSVHEAITARQCELCRVDFNVFRWRNVCLKCKKIICSVCLTKKQIDLSQFPPEFMRDVLENQQLLQASRRDSIIGFGNTIKLCDLCYVGIDPNSVEVNEEYGGWTVKGGISPPRTPPATAPASGSADSVVTPNNNANTGTDLRLPPSIAIFHPPTSV